MRLIFVNLFFCNLFYFFTGSTGKAEVGPYKATLTRVEPCKKPPKPYEKEPGMFFFSEIYTSGKKTLLRGNLTVVKVNPNMRILSKGFFFEDDKWKPVYVANSVGCHGVLMKVFKLALNVQHHSGCVPKGTYLFNNVDINAAMQTWTKTYVYGKYRFKVTVVTKAASTVCWEFDTLHEPITTE